MSENRILAAFRVRYQENRADLEAFDRDAAEQAFGGPSDAIEWCREWWEERLQGRALDHGERRLRGTQGRN